MAEPLRGHLVFSCGASVYAVAAERAVEVVNLPGLTRVPGAPGHLLGVFAHRGEVMPVIDLLRLLGHDTDTDAARPGFKRAVLVRVPHGAVALTATKVWGVTTLSGAPERLAESGALAHLRGPARAPAGDVSIIEAEGFIDFLSRSA